MGYEFYETNFNNPTVKLVLYVSRSHTPKSQKTNIQRSSNETKLFDGYKTKNHDLTVILTPILMIFYNYTP